MAKKQIAISIISILVFSLVSAGFLVYQMRQASEVRAGVNENVSGYAWSENIGWISFNGTNVPGGADYGVHICTKSDPNPLCSGKQEGEIVGYAWSENIGWIDFDPSGPYPASPNYSAKVDMDTKELSGWVRALAGGTPEAGGWDGWIKLRGSNYGVWVDDSVSPAEFRGWAWGSDIIGWISFNCSNQGVCGTSDYKVVTSFAFNQAPTVNGMQDPDNTENYCNIAPGLGQVSFQWKYNDADGDTETRFDFRVNNVNNVADPNPEIDKTVNNPSCTDTDPGKALSCINTQSGTVGTDLSYNTTYYWWVRVYDNQGNDSGWVQGPSFKTTPHAWPWPDFTCNDADCESITPAEEEVITLKSVTTYYDGQGHCEWALPVGAVVDSGNPNWDCELGVKFQKGENQEITLTAFDSDGYNCPHTETINVTEPVPEWEEITPY